MPHYDLDTVADAYLDAQFGSTTLGPASYVLRLWDEDPLNGGVEVTGTDLPALTITNNATNFPAASNGVKTTPIFTFTASAVTATASWMSLHRASDDKGVWRARLSGEWGAQQAGDQLQVTCVITAPNDVT